MPDFRIVSTAKPPGQCILCGSFDRPLVETVPELELPGYGNVMVCSVQETMLSGCLEQMARLVGLVEQSRLDKVSGQRDQLKRQLEAQADEIRKLRAQQVTIPRSEYEDLLARADR